MGSEPQSIFFAKSSTSLSSVSPYIVSMNNEFSPAVLWLELSHCCNDIITIVLGVKGVPLKKCHDQGAEMLTSKRNTRYNERNGI
jgi:hypothetical protein